MAVIVWMRAITVKLAVIVPMELVAEIVIEPGVSGVMAEVTMAQDSVTRVQVMAPHASKRTCPEFEERVTD